MANIAHWQHSDNPLERASYWAVTAGWTDPNLFEQAQADSQLYQEMARQLRIIRASCREAGDDINVDWLDRQLAKLLGEES